MSSTNKDGFLVQMVRSATVSAEIIPALGAKISSLVNLQTGREWMWSPPERMLFANKTGDSFPDGTKIGADECFPTIAACEWRGRSLPDHGEVWTEAWDAAIEDGRVKTSINCPISPFRLERTASLSGSCLRLDYAATNLSSEHQECLWAIHPLLTIEPGDELHLPASSFRVDASMGCGLGDRGAAGNWPSPRVGMQLDRLDFGNDDPAAVKVFTDSLQEGVVTVRNRNTRDQLIFRFDPNVLNTVGVWINRGGWNGYHHLAIEPTNGAPDRLDIAAQEWARCWTLAPKETRRWWVSLEVSSYPVESEHA